MDSVVRVPSKAVIPAAGLGQRLHPITQVLPKEMFPVGCYPSIEWVIAEAVASGCTDIAVVVSPRKQIITDYLMFHCPALTHSCRLTILVQQEPLGLGHALLLARDFCEGQPCAVLLPDDLVAGPQPPLLQLAAAFSHLGGAVFALTQGGPAYPGQSGRWPLRKIDERIYAVKCDLEEASSDSSVFPVVGIGRYLLSPDCLDYPVTVFNLSRIGEFDDRVLFSHMLAAGQPVHGVSIEGRRYDISTIDGYMAAWQQFGKESPHWQQM